MTRRIRKLIGTAIIIGFVTIYALVAMALAQAPLIQNAAGWVQGIFYVVAGMGWIVPIIPLIGWMERLDRPASSRGNAPAAIPQEKR